MIDDDLDPELLGALMMALPAEQPSDALKERLLKSTQTASRFERFLARVGELCDLASDKTQALLDSIDDASLWNPGTPGVSLFDIQGGPKVANAVVGFVRMPAGAQFPEHSHLGDEVVLVMQGSYRDDVDGSVHRAGDEVHKPAGTTHSFTALPGPDLLYLVVVEKGLKMGEAIFGPGDPGA
jgi:quercetin dioxygenase-like cupin family protein